MVFLRGADVHVHEAFLFNYWLLILKMLKIGLPWDFLMEISEAQLYMILGVQTAIEQKENEDQQSEMANAHIQNKFGSL
jgi:hypothetical protein